jgi:AcrR family transcriptional regulator
VARPRKVSDDEVFRAAGRVMAQVGPSQLKLSDIAAEAGLTAGALVQRFGSKRELLLTLVSGWSESIPTMFGAMRASQESPLMALRKYVDGMAQMGDGPGGVAHHLGWLQLDLGDPAFHAHARRGARATRQELNSLVEEAIAKGELKRGTDAGRLARTVEVTVGGSLLTWAFHQEGSARQFLRDDLATALAPHLTKAGRALLCGPGT